MQPNNYRLFFFIIALHYMQFTEKITADRENGFVVKFTRKGKRGDVESKHTAYNKASLLHR